MSNDFFAHKANIYDSDNNRVANVDNIANAIIKRVNLNRQMHLIDFGSGTGLLLERIAPFVQKITAIDISPAMIVQLEKKRHSLKCELDILGVDLESTDITHKFDGIISSMTMHHVKDIAAMFVKFYSMLNMGGIIAIADIDKEDGSFHTQESGVYHCGFERSMMAKVAIQAGFQEVEIVEASVVHKAQGEYPVFLLTAKK
jgi:cyclopropane fatty-acyl-phospholipid synthase-like methyltransferase